ncbi:hypothetical protein VM98_33240, partial [Streptomyces rubellomurinus subsp. indigoferus]
QLAVPGYRPAALIAGIAFYLPVTAATWGVGVWGRAVAEAAERDRRELARARDAVRHERTQIARVLHGILANPAAVLVLQAAAARAAGPGAPPPGAHDALGRIEEVGRGAMGGLRRLLRLLRTADATVDAGARRRGLADLAALLEDVRQAGVTVDLEVRGTPAHL